MPNGSCLIHDFEIAAIGSTSEEVESELKTEISEWRMRTGREINFAIKGRR